MAKYQKYAEYKDSGVEWLGEIPSHWKLVKLSYKLKLLSGDGITALDIEETGNYPVYGGNGVRGFTEKYNCDGSYPLIGRQGALCGNINVANGKFFATEHAVVVYPYEKFNLTFLSEFLRFMDLGQYSVSAAQPGIAVDRINTLPIVIPPLEEQDSIGDFLDHETAKIDTLIVKQEKLIELLKEKRQAVISHAVTKGLNPHVPMKDSGVEWLGEVPEHWAVVKGGYIGTLFGSESIAEEDVIDDGELPFIKVSSLSVETFKLNSIDWFVSEKRAKFCKTEKNYIVFPKRGAAIFTNKVNVVDIDSVIDPNLMGWKIGSKGLTEYFTLLLKTRRLDDIADVSTVPQINNKHIAPEKFPLPPLREQSEIIAFVSSQLEKFEKLINAANSAIQLMQERRTALISAAVTGKIDVRNWQAPNATEQEMEVST